MLHFTRTGCSPCPRVSQPPDSRLVCAESPLLRQRRFELPARSPCRPQSVRLGGGHAAVGLGSAGGAARCRQCAVLSGGAARWALGTALGSGCSKLHGLTAPGEVRMGCIHGAAGPGTPPPTSRGVSPTVPELCSGHGEIVGSTRCCRLLSRDGCGRCVNRMKHS